MMFSIKRKTGTVRNSCFKILRKSRTYIDVPFVGSKCLVDDIEKVIVSEAYTGWMPYNYKLEGFPESHHME